MQIIVFPLLLLVLNYLWKAESVEMTDCSWVYSPNVIVHGGIGVSRDSLASCQSSCLGRSGCVSIDWYYTRTGKYDTQCYYLETQTPKELTKDPVKHFDYICTVRDCSWVYSPKVRIVGGKGVWSDSIASCQRACLGRSGCVAIDWNYNETAVGDTPCWYLEKQTGKELTPYPVKHFDYICTVRGYCPIDWYFHAPSGFCYYVSDRYATQAVAQEYCAQNNASLVKVESVNEMNFLWQLILKQRASCTTFDDCKNYWTRLRFSPYNETDFFQWKWNDGSPVGNSRQPFPYSTLTSPDCATFKVTNDETNVHFKRQNCDRSFRYICKMNCPYGFVEYPPSNTCYKLLPIKFEWDEANDRCRNENVDSQLATIMTADQNKGIANYINDLLSKDNSTERQLFYSCRGFSGNAQVLVLWTSGRRRDESKGCESPFVWRPKGGVEQNLSSYTNWLPRTTDCFRISHHCMSVKSGEFKYQWAEELCIIEFCPLCEIATKI